MHGKATQSAEIPSTKSLQSGFKPETHEIINEHLKDHQITADWDKRDLIRDIHTWRERFILEFKLKIEELPTVMIDVISRYSYGHFRPGRNGFGLRNEIAINQRFIDSREYWDVLGTLLHELLHLEQELAGKPGKHNYHNKAYRKRAASLGLIVDEWGHSNYAPSPSPFWDVLAKYEITVPEMSAVIEPAPLPGQSKLKLWICDCKPQPVRVRVAIEDFQARCLKCGTIFHRVD
jgi:hypothetical protein